jgi:hypothetical protein
VAWPENVVEAKVALEAAARVRVSAGALGRLGMLGNVLRDARILSSGVASNRSMDNPMTTKPTTAPDFVKLDDAGNELPADAGTWSQVLDRNTQLIWCADPLDRAAWKQALSAAAGHTLGGFAWRAPDIREQLSIVDYTRFNPAFDPTYFRGDVAMLQAYESLKGIKS